MSASTSLYRKYRSQDFDELVGQEPVVQTLKNAIAGDRVSHAYLFTGPRGVGKTSAARLLARAANCLSEGVDKPCNQCANCLAVNKELVTDLIEIDAASNTGVDNIREIIERANFAPSVWHTKFYVVDEVHMLSVSAFNALLKTLEEPPPHTAFILATTEIHKVPATVASRCQRFDFRKIPLVIIADRLQYVCSLEGIEADRPALELVARQATGSLRDALSLLDQLRVFAHAGITVKSVRDMLGASDAEQIADFTDTLLAGDLAAGLRQINSLIDEGLDPRQFNKQLVEHLRNLLLVKTGAASGDPTLLDTTEEMRARLEAQADQMEMGDLLRRLKAFAEADAAIRSATHLHLPLEMALVQASLGAGESLGRHDEAALPPTAAEPRSRPMPAPRPARAEPGLFVQNGKAAAEPPAEELAARGHSPGRASDAEAEQVEAEPEAAVQAEGMLPGEGDELERLRLLWPRLVEHISARSKSIGSAFRNSELVRPFKIDGEQVTISFQHKIQAERTRTEPYRSIIEDALNRVLGHKCILESILFSEEENGGQSADPSPDKGNGGGKRVVKEKKPSPYETSRGRAAMNIFNITKFDE